MSSTLVAALQEARSQIASAPTDEAGEAAVATKLAREIDQSIARLRGEEIEKDLISIVCHDLKDPLASIVMGAGFLKKSAAAEDASARRVIEAIARSAERMSQVVSDFHDLSKLDSGRLVLDRRPCDAVAAVRATVSTFQAQASERDVRLEVQADKGPLMVSCDRARLSQIVSKLLGNALRFTPAGGHVVVRVAADGGRARFSVVDTGRGIAGDRIPSIFDHAANARRSPRDGPGLGLAIAKGLVELHGGELSVESRVDEGSSFVFSLLVAS